MRNILLALVLAMTLIAARLGKAQEVKTATEQPRYSLSIAARPDVVSAADGGGSNRRRALVVAGGERYRIHWIGQYEQLKPLTATVNVSDQQANLIAQHTVTGIARWYEAHRPGRTGICPG